MLVGGSAERAQVAILEDAVLVENYVGRRRRRSLVGNVYLGKVQNVLRGMEAAFVDIGQSRNAVLYVGEVMNEADEDVEGDARPVSASTKSSHVGQTVLVQVTKDPMGTKGARLTTEVSLAGRYLVLVPRGSGSRDLPAPRRSRAVSGCATSPSAIRPEGFGVIVRTAAEGVEEDELARDLERLTRLWEEIDGRAEKGSAPLEIYVEPDLVIRVVRDLFSKDYDRLVVEDRETYERVATYLTRSRPSSPSA